jgi:hypothetical protein
MDKSTKKTDQEIELRPDGWERFEKAVDAAVKGGPRHRVKPSQKSRGGSKREPRRTERGSA